MTFTVLFDKVPKRRIIVNAFTQSLGAELLTNGNFAAWTGNNPNGWTVTESPPAREVSESTGTALCVNDGSGSLALAQAVLSAGLLYEAQIEVVTNAVAGNATLSIGDAASLPIVLASTGAKITLDRAKTANFYGIFCSNANNLSLDNASVKRITPNAFISAIASGSFRHRFVLPASPMANDQIHLTYRMTASGQEFLNGWDCYLRRNNANNAWDILLDSISNGTRTPRRVVTGVGDVTGIRVDASGSTHQLYTFASNTWTAQGAPVNVSFQDTAIGVNTICNSTFTQNSLEITSAV